MTARRRYGDAIADVLKLHVAAGTCGGLAEQGCEVLCDFPRGAGRRRRRRGVAAATRQVAGQRVDLDVVESWKQAGEAPPFYRER